MHIISQVLWITVENLSRLQRLNKLFDNAEYETNSFNWAFILKKKPSSQEEAVL